jgi:HSP20 family protein
LEEGFASVSGSNLALDMYETEDAIVIETSPIPGIKAEEIEVSITGDVLTIRGETRPEGAEAKGQYLRQERQFGSFSRAVTIPRPIKAEETAASFKDNVLTITIPKAEEAKPKVINIQSTDE